MLNLWFDDLDVEFFEEIYKEFGHLRTLIYIDWLITEEF
jgi:hypothetical protein